MLLLSGDVPRGRHNNKKWLAEEIDSEVKETCENRNLFVVIEAGMETGSWMLGRGKNGH